MTDEEKLQKYLPLIRTAAGWTAEELGNKIGVTKQTISNIETQKTKISKTQYLAIQMVISQKIASSPEDLTLANIMKLLVFTDNEPSINYDAVSDAIEVAKNIEKEAENAKEVKHKNPNALKKNATGIAAGGIVGAISMIGLSPVAAITSAVLGATIAPWLTKAVEGEK